MGRPDAVATRRDLLAAAARLVKREGVAALTLDAVAKEAGRSKGGVLYHFPTKEALVLGLIEEQAARFDADVTRRAEALPAGPGRWLRAYVDAAAAAGEETDDGALTGGLLAAVATDRTLLEPFRAVYQVWQERAEHDAATAALGTVVRLAADGLWYAEFFGLAAPSGRLLDEVIDALRRLAEGEPVGSPPPEDS